MTLDPRVLQPAPPALDRLAAARAAMLAETAKPRASWKRSVALLVAASTGLAALVAGVALALGETSPAVVSGHAVTLLLVGLTGPVAAWAALQPGHPWARGLALGLAGAAGVALVLSRPAEVTHNSTSPEWVCTASHVAVALPAIIIALWVLRSFAARRLRAVAAGLAVGTTGAALGELLCGRNALHIATFHLAAWLLVATVVTLVSRALRPRSFAP